MRKLLTILCLFFSLGVSSQCVSNQSFLISSPGPYSPGDVVAVDYTLGTFTQLNINWIIAFQINLGVGWTNLIPLIAPVGGWNTTWLLGVGFTKHIPKWIKLWARLEIYECKVLIQIGEVVQQGHLQ